jgi:hypothetical protein
MNNPSSPTLFPIALNSSPGPFPASLCLSLVTSSFLLSLVVAQSLVQKLIEVGEMSEEFFRGDRLPVLNFPEPDREGLDRSMHE